MDELTLSDAPPLRALTPKNGAPTLSISPVIFRPCRVGVSCRLTEKPPFPGRLFPFQLVGLIGSALLKPEITLAAFARAVHFDLFLPADFIKICMAPRQKVCLQKVHAAGHILLFPKL